MLKKLRIKFIAIIMVIVTLVLTVAFSTICFVEYQRANADLENAMQTLIERAADNMSNPRPDDMRPDENGPQSHTDQNGPHIGGADRDKASLYPIALYALSPDDSLESVDDFATASIESDVLATAQKSITGANDGYGLVSGTELHYLKRTIGETTFVAFADSSNTDGWKSLALTLLLVGVAALAVFFVLSLMFSRWALLPVEKTWESQRRFVTDASHELKTPLTVILANTSILLSHPEHSIAQESKWLESTQAETQRMQGLVGEMLELAQVEERAPRESERIDLSDIVKGQALEFESVAFEGGFALESKIADGIAIEGDPERMRKLVSTLIENASKYVNNGGMVSISLSREGKAASYSVANTGSFIEAADLAHIFDRFYRSDKARSSETGGFGLGLSIAQEIAKSHGGDIVATSTPEAGTRFTVTLPLAK